MRKLILIIFIALNFSLNAQNFTVITQLNQHIYAGIQNEISINYKGIKPNKIVVKGSLDCSVEKMQGNKYSVITRNNELSTCKIYIGKKKKMKIIWIDSMEFKILKSPKFKTALNNMECDNGIINLPDLLKADSLKINYDCITFNYILNISKFNITIVPKMGEITNFALKQNLITQEIKEKFIELKTGDIIIFDGVRSVNKNGLIRALTPIIFTIYNN